MSINGNELDLDNTANAEGPVGNFEFFDTPAARQEVFTITRSLAEYIHDQSIENLVLMDRAARPAYQALQQYWKTVYKDKKMPDVYFINPKGFMTEERLAKKDPINKVPISTYYEVHALKTGDVMDPENIRDEKEIIEDFSEIYHRLLEDPTDDTLIFDVCLHSGKSMEPVLETFRKAGVPNLQWGLAGDHRRFNRRLKPNFIAKAKVDMWCMPFAADKSVEKPFGSVHSRPPEIDLDNDGVGDIRDPEKLQQGNRLRQEIRRIMDFYLAADLRSQSSAVI